MNISYVDFWGGFNPDDFWFSSYFRNRYKKEFNFNSNPEDADIIIGSCFGNSISSVKNNKAVKIFYTGENQRPNLTQYDYSITFDYDDFGDRNVRLPLWYLYVNWWGDECLKDNISLDEANRKFDPVEVYNRENFCCIMIGNPVQNRIEVAQSLNTYKPVQGYGAVFNNRFTGKKLDLLQNFRYNICFENSLYDGYHTEKLLEAKLAGCIPIYYGPDSASLDFNKSCYINYKDFGSPSQLTEYIKEIDEDVEKFIQIASQPLFIENPTFAHLDNFFDRFM